MRLPDLSVLVASGRGAQRNCARPSGMGYFIRIWIFLLDTSVNILEIAAGKSFLVAESWLFPPGQP